MFLKIQGKDGTLKRLINVHHVLQVLKHPSEQRSKIIVLAGHQSEECWVDAPPEEVAESLSRAAQNQQPKPLSALL